MQYFLTDWYLLNVDETKLRLDMYRETIERKLDEQDKSYLYSDIEDVIKFNEYYMQRTGFFFMSFGAYLGIAFRNRYHGMLRIDYL